MKSTSLEKPRLNLVEKPHEKRLRLLGVGENQEMVARAKKLFEPVQDAVLEFVPDTETAMRMLADEAYDLVVVDPAITAGGFAMLMHIKNTYRWIATLVVSGNRDPQFLRQVVKCRIDGLMFRPVTPTELIEQAMLLARAVNANRQRQQRRILAIGAHPDDVEIGCGGALAKHHVNHDVLHILTLSRGSAGGDTNVRAAEAHRAADLLGATLQLGNLRDTHISDGAETIALIEKAIRDLEPTHVYTHCAEDTHQDHRATHAATLVAARGVPNVYCYQSPSSTVEFRPHRFVDITDFIKQKIQAIDVYKSQTERMDALQHDVILSTARYWGRYAGYVLAEPMRIVRQRDDHQGTTVVAPQTEAQDAPAAD